MTTTVLSFFTAEQVDSALEFITLKQETTRTRMISRHLPKCSILKEVYFNLIMFRSCTSSFNACIKANLGCQWFKYDMCLSNIIY